MHTFFRLIVGNDRDAWHLAIREVWEDRTPLDMWAYTRCDYVSAAKPVPFALKVDGRRNDYYQSAFGVPVVLKRLAELWQSVRPTISSAFQQ